MNGLDAHIAQTDDRDETNEVDRIAMMLRGGVLTTGDVASLRRMDPRNPAAAFYKVEGLVLEGALPGSEAQRMDRETRWAAIVSGLAHLGPLHRNTRNDHTLALGRVLGDAQYAEQRFVRLLQADAERLIDELPLLARYLVAKSLSVDWNGASRLVLSAGGQHEERVRRHLARDYYSLLANRENR